MISTESTTPAVEIPDEPTAAIQHLAEAQKNIKKELSKVIIGNEEIIDQVLTAFFAGGHCLLMGVPGLAKTLLVNTLSQTMHLDFKRVQFTPDLMPTDITGTNILEENPDTGRRNFVFQRGPIFTNMLLADEINRTPPKTQAALLEAMQERQVTNGSNIMALPKPFLVLATQNPLEQEGTYNLPEAQLDRFIFLVKIEFSEEEQEVDILLSTTRGKTEPINPVLNGESILKYQAIIKQIPVGRHVAQYATRLMRATRPDDPKSPGFAKDWISYGCGPRAGQSMILAAKAHAALNGRYDVSCDDIKAYAVPVLRHRIALNFTAISDGLTNDEVVEKIIEAVPEVE
ncbi:MAG: MoxR family ATPase [Verrucomicrobiota bacterium]